MKDKIILLILVAGAALAYQFQDQLFDNQPADTNVKFSSKVETPVAAPKRTNAPIRIDIVVINKTMGHFEKVPELEKMTLGLNKLFERHGRLTFNIYYNFYNSYEEVPPEKWDSLIVITRTLAALELIKQGKEVNPILYVSPLADSCFQEVQVAALYNSNIGSIAELSNKTIFVEGLTGVNNLPIRRFVTEENIEMKALVTDVTVDQSIEKMYQQSIDASIVHTGVFTSLNQTANNFRILKTSDYKIPCYTLLINKRMPEDTTANIKSQLLFASSDKSLAQMLKSVIGIQYLEEIPAGSLEDLQTMATKYAKAEAKFYTPPPVEEKPVLSIPPLPGVKELTPEQAEIEKQRAMMQQLQTEQEKQQEQIKAQQEKQMQEMKAQQEKQQEELKLLQEKLLQQQKESDSRNQFKSPQEIMQEQKI